MTQKTIEILEQVLVEERAARAGLALELEKERNAAASAADEALSMILRLQEDKASIEMEAKQHQRMIEEKFAFDAEEVSILKEILLRREREKHYLEKEVDIYRQMFLETEQSLPNTPGSKPAQIERSQTPLQINEPWDDMETADVSSGFDIFTSQMDSRLLALGDILGKRNMFPNMRRNSMSAIDCERLKIESEVGLLRGRLRAVQKGREKISFSSKEQSKSQVQRREDKTSLFWEAKRSGPLDSSSPSSTMVKTMSMTLDLHSA